MHNIPAENEYRMLGTHERKIGDAPNAKALLGHLITHHAQLCRSFLNDILAGVGCAKHERELAVKRADNCVFRKQEPCPRPGKASKHKSRNERQRHEANEDLDHGYDVAVKRLWM